MNSKHQSLMIVPPGYSLWCAAQRHLQDWWRADGEKTSNIHVGDRFCLYPGREDWIGVVSDRTFNMAGELRRHNPAQDGTPLDFFSYEIGGYRGGHWHAPKHSWFIEVQSLTWLPSLEQLLIHNEMDKARELMLFYTAEHFVNTPSNEVDGWRRDPLERIKVPKVKKAPGRKYYGDIDD